MIRPSLRAEKALFRDGHHFVAGCDEVGRGALAGPVSVGILLIDPAVRRVPPGLADSKLLTPARREQLVPAVERWSLERRVGHASPAEIDAFGIIVALRLAALRALAALTVQPDVVILDGNHDYLSPRPHQVELFAAEPPWPQVVVPRVVTRIKADQKCASVAGASIIAKTTRDRMMQDLAHQYPEFGWKENKGYAAPEHMAQLHSSGPCIEHRRSWRLPVADGLDDSDGFDDADGFDECEDIA